MWILTRLQHQPMRIFVLERKRLGLLCALTATLSLSIGSANAAASNLRTRLSDALGTKAWPVSTEKFGPVTLITYNCECKMGNFAFLDVDSRLITQRDAWSGLDYVIEHDARLHAGHRLILLIDTGETFLGASPIQAGGHRLTFANTIGECEACAPFAALKFGFDFDKTGRFKAWRQLGYTSLAVAAHGKSPPGN